VLLAGGTEKREGSVDEMTMPQKIANNPVKRREYLAKLCGLPDGQMKLRFQKEIEIERVDFEKLKAIICGESCGEGCPNWEICNKYSAALGYNFVKERI
jgi:hypothetical protein